jgi:hypothetical protein
MSKNIKKQSLSITADRKILESDDEDIESSSKVVVDEKMIDAVLKTIQTHHKINKDKQIEQRTKIFELEEMNKYYKSYAEKFHNENIILKTQHDSMKNKGVNKNTYKMLSDVDSIGKNNDKEIDECVEINKKKVAKNLLEIQKNLFGPI